MPILSPSAEATIENCIPVLEAYTDLESIISLAQTCRTLHRLFVDHDTNRIKVTHFEVESFPVPHPTSLVLTTAAPVKNWRTAPARIPHYLTRALSAIHFPSLRRLHLDFPLTRRRNHHVIDDACSAAFPFAF